MLLKFHVHKLMFTLTYCQNIWFNPFLSNSMAENLMADCKEQNNRPCGSICPTVVQICLIFHYCQMHEVGKVERERGKREWGWKRRARKNRDRQRDREGGRERKERGKAIKQDIILALSTYKRDTCLYIKFLSNFKQAEAKLKTSHYQCFLLFNTLVSIIYSKNYIKLEMCTWQKCYTRHIWR